MKHIIKSFLISLILIVSFSLVGCGIQGTKLKVYDSIPLTSESYAFAVKKGNTALKERVDNQIQKMKNDGTLATLINSYFDGTATFSYHNPDASPKAGDNKYFVVGTNAYFPPFETFKENGDFYGVDIEIASLLAQNEGKTLYIYDQDFDSLIGGLENHFDIVMAGMTVNETRRQSADFCEEYYESAQVLITKDGDTRFQNCQTSDDIENVFKSQNQDFKILTQSGTTGFMYCQGNEDFGYEGFSNVTTLSLISGALCLQDLKNGKADAVVLDKQPALMITKVSDQNPMEIFFNYFNNGGYKTFLNGLKNTCIIAFGGLIIGFLLGCVVALIKLIPNKNWGIKVLEWVGNIYITVFRGTPMVVQLLLLHFALFPLMHINISSVSEALIIFGFNSGAYMAEMIRSGIKSIDVGQMEAGRCVGMPYSVTMIKIILPQAVKNILPTIGNELISLVKETSVVSFIAVVDITKSLQNIASATYEYFIPYIFLAIVYLVIVLIITFALKGIEKGFEKNEK